MGYQAIHLLSDRQKEILLLFKQGFRPKIISEKLGIKIKTVNSHIDIIIKKLGVNNRAEIIDFLINLEPVLRHF